MFRGALFIHAYDREVLDRVWNRIQQAIREEVGRAERFDFFGVQTVETPEFLKRERERFDRSGAGLAVKEKWDTHGVGDVLRLN